LEQYETMREGLAAYEKIVKERPNDRILVKHRARVLRKSWEKD